ncbi:hypothetical protein MKW98_006794 [Papaver atlanticum]|uniref:Dof zinc finger protein n=1 Tax=Papaver atlanticum TaxID=357466 RepID=A0AAD4XFI5_9MAGN|nr:hypothetical protein MKW98_006794 [Papaver atlanticum]
MDNPATLLHHQITPEQLEDILASTNSSGPYTLDEKKVRPQQEQAPPSLKCPRCDSTNTKFCYYNNYSLSQPRYFCKSCKRYWTQGGSIRKIPVGGSCKKKSNKKSSSESTQKSKDQSVSTTNCNPVPSLTSVSNDVTLTFSRHQNHKQLTTTTTSEHILGLDPDIEPMSTVFGSHGNTQFDTLRSSTSTSTTNNSNSNPNTLLFEALKSGSLETQSGNHSFSGYQSMGEGMLPYIHMNGTKEIAATTTTATVTTITRKQEFYKDIDGENNTSFGNFPWQVNEESNMSSVVGSGKELYSNGGLGSSWFGLINNL